VRVYVCDVHRYTLFV